MVQKSLLAAMMVLMMVLSCDCFKKSEEAAYEGAMASHSPEESWKFLEDYPNSTHRDSIEIHLKTATYDELENDFENKNLAYDENTKWFSFPSYEKNVRIPKGSSLHEMGSRVYSDFGKFRSQYGLGGMRALSDFSAYESGYRNPSQIIAGNYINFYSVDKLGLTLIDMRENRDNFVSKIVTGKIRILSCKITSH
jgi:hypothetical protein